MKKEKIAILVDSGADVAKDLSKDIFVLPLIVQIDEQTYIDGESINLDEVLAKLDNHKISTSLPNPRTIYETLEHIKSLGYTHVIAMTISSGLSGTYNVIRMIAEDYSDLVISVIDTLNISKGSGYSAYLALEMIKEGKSFAEINTALINKLNDQKVFFTIGTLEYLKRGGRIGLVAATVANILNLKPIISCNEHGVYYTVKKTIGYSKAINLLLETAYEFIKSCQKYDLTVLVARVDEKIQSVIEHVKSVFSKVRNFEIKAVTPALAIHIGPESFGLALRKL